MSDWLPAYNRFADAQRCWRRPLARVEAAAADGGPADTARYEQTVEFYRRIERMDALEPLAMTLLTRKIRGMISAYPEGRLKTRLENAVPKTFASPVYPGMPPHNNAPGLAIRYTVPGSATCSTRSPPGGGGGG